VPVTNAGHIEDIGIGPVPDLPPTIVSTPNPSFTEGVADTYDMSQHWTDDAVSTVTSVLSNVLPNGLSYNSNTHILDYDGLGIPSVSQHQLTATDAVGSDISSNFSVTIAVQVVSSNWVDRSTALGVTMAHRFDTQAEVDDWVQTQFGNVSWQQSGFASGFGCARINVLKTSGPDAGTICLWLKDDQTEFTENDTFYVSFRQYVPAYHATHRFLNGGGWKQIIISRHASSMGPAPYGSNQSNEIVLQNTGHRGIVQGYNQDGGSFPAWEISVSTPCLGSDFTFQNLVDRVAGTPNTCLEARQKYGGLYSYYQQQPPGYVSGEPDPQGGAFNYYPDEWICYKLRIDVGTWGTRNTRVRLYCARDGQDWDNIIDRVVKLGNGPDFDAVWLLPYNTGRSSDATREDTYVLYDEVICSTQDIAAPVAATVNPSWVISAIADRWNAIPTVTTGSSWGAGSSNKGATLSVLDPNANGITVLGDGQSFLINSWNGGAMRADHIYYIACQGGHAGWAGNEVYELDLSEENPGWIRSRDPYTPQTAGVAYFAANEPNSRHGYHDSVHIPPLAGSSNGNKWFAHKMMAWYNPGSGATSRATVFDFTSETDVIVPAGSYLAESAWPDTPGGVAYQGSCCWDDDNELVWIIGVTGNRKLYSFNPRTASYSSALEAQFGIADTAFPMLSIPGQGLTLAYLHHGSPDLLRVYDTSNPVSIPAANNLSVSGVSGFSSSMAMLWEPIGQKVVLHKGGSNSLWIAPLPTNPLTDAWVFTERTPVVGGASPTSSQAGDYRGPYTRFQYAADLQCFILVNSVTASTYFWKVPVGGF